MENTILLGTYQGKVCAALLEDKRLCEIVVSDSEADRIYVGRVENVLPGMEAAFVNIGLEQNAFLPASEVPDRSRLKAGCELPVQTVKVPGGTKGVRVSANITIPGRMCVLTPFSKGIGVSKKITDADERERLRSATEKLCPDNCGMIVRTNAEGASFEALEKDVSDIFEKWQAMQARMQHVKAPRLIASFGSAVEKAVRDMANCETVRIIAENSELYEEAVSFENEYAPELICKTKQYSGSIPLFSVWSVPSQIDKALSRRVWLDSGAYIVIDYTEALTVIDVNSGKFTGKTGITDTAIAVNIEAAKEIAHQLRLRDIGGIVIIDFIDMETHGQNQELLDCLRTELKNDKAHSNVLGITQLGLCEMTRKRKRERINEIFHSGDR